MGSLLISYDEENLKRVSEAIVSNLTPDLIPKKWRKRNSINPMFGHCHHASACLQKVFGIKEIKLYRAQDWAEIWHWWAVDSSEKIIDLTADQYYSVDKTPPYESGKKTKWYGWKQRPQQISLDLMKRVLDTRLIKDVASKV